MILFASALREEIRPFLREISGARSRRIGGCRVSEGRLAGHDVVAGVAGEGAARVRHGLERLLDEISPRALVFFGFAGALSPDLEIGDLLLAARVMDEKGGEPAPVGGFLLESARRALAGAPAQGREGVVVSVDALLLEGAGKHELRSRRGLSGPAAVDLESATVAEIAGERRIPYLVVKSISDGLQEDLPPLLARALRADGSVDRRRLVARALLHPPSWPRLRGLERRARLCSARLASFLSLWIESSGEIASTT